MDFSRVSRFEIQPSMRRCNASSPFPRTNSIRSLCTALAIGMALLLMSAASAGAAGKVALVMVAEDYQKLQKSSVGVKRGTEIADALKARGFDVILSTNPSNASARAKLGEFSNRAPEADIALAVLIGHGTAWGGQSFFLTSNTEIGRATDLLSRGLSITNISQIAARARNGAVFFFMTAPNIDSSVTGLDARPQLSGEVGDNVVTVFSSSARVPVSRIDAVSERAAEALTTVLQGQNPMLSEAVKAASGGNLGVAFGSAADINLAALPSVETAEPAVLNPPPSPGEAEDAAAMEARLEAERQAREMAEKQAQAEQVRAEQARAEVQKAQADALKAQADARKAQAEAARAQAEAERARLEAQRIEAQAQIAMAAAQSPASKQPPIDEAQLGQHQRRQIQERLREMGLYTGAIDSIMGPLTREAIMGYQKSRGAAVTGYLTADQFEALLSGRQQ